MRKDSKILIIFIIFILISLSIAITILYQEEIMGNSYGPYEITIERNYNNESEKEMILMAENITPPDGSWWFMDYNNIRIADCVNEEAIRYYSDLINEIEQDHDLKGFDIRDAYFEYNATIDYITNAGNYNTSDQNLIEVNLTIRFSEYVNPLNGLWFEHYRCVVFNNDREIITVFGDDIEPEVIVA